MRQHIFDIESSGLIWDNWRRHAEERPDQEAVIHISAEMDAYRWRWRLLMDAASSAARWLYGQGIRKGDVCAIILRHNPAFYPLYMGISALGALPSVLAYPSSRLHPTKFAQGLEGMSKRSGLDYILTERELSSQVEPLVNGPGSTIRNVLYPMDGTIGCLTDGGGLTDHEATGSDEPCLLQHSSGTTGLQKPVALSHRAVLEHVRRYGEAIALNKSDRIVSWLPLYHDMGLIAAFYIPLICGVPLVQLSPIEWVASPAMLLRAISNESATLCWLPNFAYNFMADRVREEDLRGLNLGSVRMLINCSEPIRAQSHARFHHRFANYGLRREALAACYAMAETTFAVTQTLPGHEARLLPVDRNELSKGNVVPRSETGLGGVRICVSSGSAISGCAVRVVDENRREVPPGRVGEIMISSVSMFDGYRNYPEKTAEVMADGWYCSGDLGFIHDGECFIVGRQKDVIIVAGNNVFPEDIEDAVGNVPGVIPGRVVAFGVEDDRSGPELLCTIVESEATKPDEQKALRLAIMQAGMAMDATISRVYVVHPRWLIKSSSGKPARSANRSRALEEIAWK